MPFPFDFLLIIDISPISPILEMWVPAHGHKSISSPIFTTLNCSINSQDVKPGSYGECIRTLQRVDGVYINSFGVKKWTEIVNTQLKSLNSIEYCQVLGFSY